MYKVKIDNLKEEIIKDIEILVSIPSVRDLSSQSLSAPFGKNIRLAMNEFMNIAQRMGFTVVDYDGYAISAQLGDFEEHIGILAHIDVVEANETDWDTAPFKMTIRDGIIYGRGVNDDKGPLIGALYAAKLAYESSPTIKRSVRLIVGGAEETSWECMDYYFKHNPQPLYGFSPDGNFPIVNGEMGVLQVSLQFNEVGVELYHSEPRLNFLCHDLKVNNKQYLGDKHLSRNPQRGLNAIDSYFNREKAGDSHVNSFIKKFLNNDYKGEKLQIAKQHEVMNDLSVCMMSLNSNENGYELCLDIRYPISLSSDEILGHIKKLKEENHFELEVIKNIPPLYVTEQSPLIESLKEAYFEVMKIPAEVLTKGGASYARVLETGVAFGATFEGEDPRPHMSNERMPVASLLKATEIYAVAIENLLTKG